MFIPEAVAATFMEHWPTPLKQLSILTRSIKVPPQDAWAMGAASDWFCAATGRGEANFSNDFVADLEAAAALFPDGLMPRIGFCSWKDSGQPHAPSFGLRGVLHTITGNSERVGRAIAAHVATERPLVLHMREWRAIAPETEFRIFIRDSRVVGVSQYHHQRVFPSILERGPEISSALRRFAPALLAALPLPDAVADVYLDLAPDAAHQVILIELNPFLPQTDPCLFSWKGGGDFDGRVRVRDS